MFEVDDIDNDGDDDLPHHYLPNFKQLQLRFQSNRLELKKMKKMPIFDHFPRPGEIDPYGNQVIAVQSNDSDVTVTTNPHHELALCCTYVV